MAKVKITIDQEECIGCGTCEAICPDFFEMTDDAKAQPKIETADNEEMIKEAADACPVNVIKTANC